MDKVLPALEKASQHGMEIRNIGIGTHKIDKTEQMNIFFLDEEEKVARTKAMDEIKNRFGQEYITKASTLLRVEGNTHFLERNV